MNPWHTCHVRHKACVMTVTWLMAGILLHLPVRHQHPGTRAPSDGLHPTATGGPRARWGPPGSRSPGSMEAHCRRSVAFDCTPQPAACCPDWMARLPDALSLSRLSIPGTHDSLSLFGGQRLRCQSWGLEGQLAAGIRFLDVRCKLVRGELHVYHLCTFQRASLRGVLRRTLRFLRAHPSEAVLMRIKEELPIFPRPGFAARLHRCLLEEGRGRVWCQEEVPTLGQVRGKIVVLEALARKVLGIPYEQLSISDDWNVLSLERKWARARRHLERAASGDPATMHLTFCSGNGLFTCPKEVARFVNPRCYQHLRRRGKEPVRWGVVIMDFPGAGLLRLIVESNAPRASGLITAAHGTPMASPWHPHGRRDRRRRQHSSAPCPRRCLSGRALLPAPCLCQRTAAPTEQRQVSSSGWAVGSRRRTTV